MPKIKGRLRNPLKRATTPTVVTLDDLLAYPIKNRELAAWCAEHRLHHEKLDRIRFGRVRKPTEGTILELSRAFAIDGVSEARVRAAVAGSLKAAAE